MIFLVKKEKKTEGKAEGKPENAANTNYNNNAIKIDPSIFVSLKKGSISSTYKIGNVLGEGDIFLKYLYILLTKKIYRGIRQSLCCCS